MGATRRTVLFTLAGAAAGAVMLRGAEGQMAPQPMPSPNAPSNPNMPAGLDGPEIIHPDRAPRVMINRTEIRADVEKLYVSVVELRDQVSHTDLNATLPLGVVKKAHEIEKLAKRIREHANG